MTQNGLRICAPLRGTAAFVALVVGSLLLSAQDALPAQDQAVANPGFVECQGFVYPNKRFVLKLQPGEQVIGIMVSKGERVKAGQLMARIEDPSLLTAFMDLTSKMNDRQAVRDDIEVLTLDLALHRAAVERLTAKIENIKDLKNTLPNYPVEKETEPLIDKRYEIEDQIKIANAKLAHLQARSRAQQETADLLARELEAIKTRLDQELVKAPFAGVIVEKADDAIRLSPGDVVCELWDDSAFLIQLDILQHQLAHVQRGQLATVALDFGRAEKVQGMVDSIEPGSLVPEPSGHPRFKAIVKVEKTVPWLRPGMQVTVRLRSEVAK